MRELGKQATHPVKGVQTTFVILKALKELDGASVTELADHLGQAKSSIHNYLATLEQEEYVIKENREYHVGLRFLNLGSFARQRKQIYEVAKPEVTKLAQQTDELVNVMVEEHGRGIYIFRDKGNQAVRVDAHTGHRVRMHNTALGKAMLAFLPKEYVDQILDVHGMSQTTPHTITDRATLMDELESIRERKVAFDREERLEGLRCVAVPITNEGRAVGAISVSGPRSRLQGEHLESELPEKLDEAANVIELNITYA